MNASPTYLSLWNLLGNPVFRRYAAARLRPVKLGIQMLFCQVMVGFMWLVAVLVSLRGDEGAGFTSDSFEAAVAERGVEAALAGWVPVLLVQGLLVIIKGTFSVATGVAREGNEGMMDALRLTPLPTAHRVLGQLLGLPVKENLLALSLLPWVGLCVWLGDLPIAMVGKVYLLLATSALFHHALGLVAGTIIRQKILAGTLSQICVILLHFVLPNLGKFGIGMLANIAVEPAIRQIVCGALPGFFVKHGLSAFASSMETVRFFDWEMGLPGYHWLITVSGLAMLLWILARRWDNPESQLLGKVGSLVLSAWLLLLTCGEFIPRLNSGWYPGRDFRHLLEHKMEFPLNDAPSLLSLLWVGMFGLSIGVVNLILASGLVPSPQARKRAVGHPWWSDGRDALVWIIAISAMSAFAWWGLLNALSKGSPSIAAASAHDACWLLASLVIPAAAWYSLILWRGLQQSLVIGFLVSVLPLMVSLVCVLALGGTWGGLNASALLLPWHGVMLRFDPGLHDLPTAVFYTSLVLHAVAAATFWIMALGRRNRAPVSGDSDP